MSAPRARPLFSLGAYAVWFGVLALHALIALLLLPTTLLFDRDRCFVARVGANLLRTVLRIPPKWRGAMRSIATIDLSRPAVVVMNHRSVTDIAIALSVPGAPRVSAKPWVRKVPFFTIGIWNAGHVVIGEGGVAEVREALARMRGLLERGVSVLVFPEGTRGTEEGLGTFHGGAFQLAVAAGVDVLPVVLHHTGDLIPRDRILFHDVEVVIDVLDRIPPGNDRKALQERVHEAMAARLARRVS